MNVEKNNPFISFILPNYNNQHVVDLFFEKFIQYNTYDNYEFIVVDDGSEDDGLKLLYKWQKSGKIKNMKVIAEPHKGIINTLNKCLAEVKGEFIIRMDGDATVETESFVEKFLEFYLINPEKIGVISAKVMTDAGFAQTIGRDVISEFGLKNRGHHITEPVGKRNWDQGSWADDNFDELMNKPAEVDTVLGVFTFCDTVTARKIGGFDKDYPLWVEDDDFYFSFRLHGKKCFYLPCIEICHRFSLRGNRDPKSWSHKKNVLERIRKVIWSCESKYNNIKYRFFGMPIIQIKDGGENSKKKTKIYVLNHLICECDLIFGWREKILIKDYIHWMKKWGFHPLNPDMKFIKEKYKGTEILWDYDDNLRKIGQDILNEYSKIKGA